MTSLLETATVTLHGKEEEYVFEDLDKSCIKLICILKKVQGESRQATKSVCLVYGVPIQGFVEVIEQSGQDTYEGVQALMRYLPDNTLWSLLLLNSWHDQQIL